MRSRRRFGRESVVAELTVRCSSVQFLVRPLPAVTFSCCPGDSCGRPSREMKTNQSLMPGKMPWQVVCQAMELRLVFLLWGCVDGENRARHTCWLTGTQALDNIWLPPESHCTAPPNRLCKPCPLSFLSLLLPVPLPPPHVLVPSLPPSFISNMSISGPHVVFSMS